MDTLPFPLPLLERSIPLLNETSIIILSFHTYANQSPFFIIPTHPKYYPSIWKNLLEMLRSKSDAFFEDICDHDKIDNMRESKDFRIEKEDLDERCLEMLDGVIMSVFKNRKLEDMKNIHLKIVAAKKDISRNRFEFVLRCLIY